MQTSSTPAADHNKSAGRKAQAGIHSGTTRGTRPTWELMGIVPGHDARDAATAGPALIALRLAHSGIAQLDWALFTIDMTRSYKPLTSRSFQSQAKRPRRYSKATQEPGAAGRKRHGSHRSEIIGKYCFTSSPVMSLHQAGVIWTSV